MRTALLSLLLVGCMQPTSSGECTMDADCGSGDVCARDQMCVVASSVRQVTAMWTVQGMPASTTACGQHPDLYIQFVGRDPGDTLGFEPVPCKNGLFTVDKLPTRYRQVELGITGGFRDVQPISAQNIATLNVVF